MTAVEKQFQRKIELMARESDSLSPLKKQASERFKNLLSASLDAEKPVLRGLNPKVAASLTRTLDAIEARKPKTMSKYGNMLHVLRTNNARIYQEAIEKEMTQRKSNRKKHIRID